MVCLLNKAKLDIKVLCIRLYSKHIFWEQTREKATAEKAIEQQGVRIATFSSVAISALDWFCYSDGGKV